MKNINKKNLLLLFVSFFLISILFFPSITSAIDAPDCSKWESCTALVCCGNNPPTDSCTFDDIFCLIRQVLDYIFGPLVTWISLLWFCFAGYKMILAQGAPEKFNEAKRMLWYGVIGIIIVLTSPILVESFLRLLGAEDWVLFFFG